MTTESRELTSPCNQTCAIDPATGLCMGCKRSMAEISGWPTFTENEKRKVLNVIREKQPNQMAK
jgi:uncharacterized protein